MDELDNVKSPLRRQSLLVHPQTRKPIQNAKRKRIRNDLKSQEGKGSLLVDQSHTEGHCFTPDNFAVFDSDLIDPKLENLRKQVEELRKEILSPSIFPGPISNKPFLPTKPVIPPEHPPERERPEVSSSGLKRRRGSWLPKEADNPPPQTSIVSPFLYSRISELEKENAENNDEFFSAPSAKRRMSVIMSPNFKNRESSYIRPPM